MQKNTIIRSLELNDYYLGFLSVLGQLTKVNEAVTFAEWKKFFDDMDMKRNQTFVLVYTDNENKQQIIGTGKILIEPKFHQNFANMGHIEDVVIDAKYRKHNFGFQLIQHLISIAKQNNCYKVTLATNERNIGFYVKCGLIIKGTEMTHYF